MSTFLHEKIKNAPQLDFGGILNESFDLYKKIWLSGFLVVLMVVILSLGLNFLSTSIGMTTGNSTFYFTDGFPGYLTFAGEIIFALPQALILGTFSTAILAGFYKVCKEADINDKTTNDLFFFFKGEYFLKIFILSIMYAGIATVAQLLLFLPYIYAYIPLSFIAVIFAFNPELSETEIVKLSFKLGTKKWFLTFGLLFILCIVAAFGIIACFIGLLFTICLMYLPMYFVYRDAIGFDELSEIDEIGKTV